MWLEFLLLAVAVIMLLVLAVVQHISHQHLPVLLRRTAVGVATVMVTLAVIGLVPYCFQGFRIPTLVLRAIYAVSGITLIILFAKTWGIENPSDGGS